MSGGVMTGQSGAHRRNSDRPRILDPGEISGTVGHGDRRVRIFPDLDALSREAASLIEQTANAAVSQRGRFAMALAGGRSPRTLYRILAAESGSRIPWEHTHLFWGDERSVPLDHPDSNYRMVARSLLSGITIPEGNVHRVRTERGPRGAAGSYERMLRRFFDANGQGESALTFDLVLLGVGSDGHTASLFPDDPGLDGDRRWVRAVRAPAGVVSRRRVTLTLPAINRSRHAVFLVSGSNKRPVMKAILDDPAPAASPYPAARVRAAGTTWWLMDEQAVPTEEVP
jgi:6-phosphogluconolactonase